MITSKKELAIILTSGNTVSESNVSKKLDTVINLWIKRKEIILQNGFYKINN